MVPLLCPRYPGNMSCRVHTVEDGEAVNKTLTTGSWLGVIPGAMQKPDEVEVTGGPELSQPQRSCSLDRSSRPCQGWGCCSSFINQMGSPWWSAGCRSWLLLHLQRFCSQNSYLCLFSSS